MSDKFDSERFELLSGIPLGLYAATLAKEGNLPPDCLNYFRKNSKRWDGQHLEMGLLFLSKIDSDEARHEIINHLEHPLKHIRLSVLGFMDQMNHFDDYALAKINERVPFVTGDFEKSWINEMHEKANNIVSK
jgi:hypothetical protein